MGWFFSLIVGPMKSESANSSLLLAAAHLKDISSKTVS